MMNGCELIKRAQSRNADCFGINSRLLPRPANNFLVARAADESVQFINWHTLDGEERTEPQNKQKRFLSSVCVFVVCFRSFMIFPMINCE